jgi:mannose-1-phosphate guanylyltransferase/mannose-6-phosphate isomerase
MDCFSWSNTLGEDHSVVDADSGIFCVEANSKLRRGMMVTDASFSYRHYRVELVLKKPSSRHYHNSQLQAAKREEHNLHRKVHRPWGWYDSIDEGGRFKVKRIQVKPGTSLQKHHRRAEHWILVKGTAEITNGDKVLLMTESQSTYIPQGQVHRLANPAAIPLEIMEVQSGSHLGEDDIIRLKDGYGRN